VSKSSNNWEISQDKTDAPITKKSLELSWWVRTGKELKVIKKQVVTDPVVVFEPRTTDSVQEQKLVFLS
jgi:hypothetical protein